MSDQQEQQAKDRDRELAEKSEADRKIRKARQEALSQPGVGVVKEKS